ncbi:MAG: glutathione synthase, partial [Chromatocurvus sp.]
MTIKLGVVMDPIADISYKKDSTMAMLWAAGARGWELFYIEPQWLCLEQGQPVATVAPLDVFKDPDRWYRLGEQRSCHLDEFDIILMRKDPPFDNQFIYATYILEAAEQLGTLVVNRCQSLRDCNEK